MAILRPRNDGYSYFEKADKATRYVGRYAGWTAVILGNGESRARHDLWRIRVAYPSTALVVACNSYYIDVERGLVPLPHFVGVVDPQITREIMESGYIDRHPCLVNPIHMEWMKNELWKEKGGDPGPLTCPKQLIELDWRLDYNCGTEMAHFALRVGCSAVVLMGFDGPSDDDTVVNNVYKGRPSCLATAFSPSPGRDQMKRMRRGWPDVPFYQVDTTWIQDAPTISFEDLFTLKELLELVEEQV